MKVLRPGDHLMIGRCLLIYGSRDEIAIRAALSTQDRHDLTGENFESSTLAFQPGNEESLEAALEANPPASELFPTGSPSLPQGLRPAQRAELSDYLAFLHEQIGQVIQSTKYPENADRKAPEKDRVEIEWSEWQRLSSLAMELAISLRRLSEPN
jgi:hypothetical protein